MSAETAETRLVAAEPTSSNLVVVATYNEIENLPELVEQILAAIPKSDILVIDDNSPDGTGTWCDEHAEQESRLRCLHRPGKLGLGSATIAGFEYAIANSYATVMTMDADFSHPPRYLPQLLERINDTAIDCDIAIGSRYTKGGKIEGWPFRRRVMSRCVNLYARFLLGLKVKDCSGAFRAYRVAMLRQVEFDSMFSQGYSYLEELLWRLKRLGAEFAETPFTFVDRIRGQTKINMREAFAAVWVIFRLGLKQWFGRKPKLDLSKSSRPSSEDSQ